VTRYRRTSKRGGQAVGLYALIRPRWASTRSLVIARPRPLPPGLRRTGDGVRAVSAAERHVEHPLQLTVKDAAAIVYREYGVCAVHAGQFWSEPSTLGHGAELASRS
jgi:hypothetical protein